MSTTTITDVHLLDAASAYDVTLAQGAIRAIEPAGSAPVEGQCVAGKGKTLLPGLIDSHVHLRGSEQLRAATCAGVTTVVELGTHPDELITQLRTEDEGCALLSAGSAASAPGSTQIAVMGFPAESGVSGTADAERFVAWRAAAGADLIKIIIEDPEATDTPALAPETLAALVSSAHARNLRTVAHVVTAASFTRGLDAGVDILTHAPLDHALPEQTAHRMAGSGTIAAPTLIMMRGVARARLGERAEQAFSHALDSVRRMHAAAVPIIAGTDANDTPGSPSPVPHGSALHDELDLLREAGLTAREALTAATSGAAAALRRTDRGPIANGQRADLLLVDGDPLDDPATARTPAAVWVAGRRAV